jgi:3-hydroxybutyryl-CoA dehydrogenase
MASTNTDRRRTIIAGEPPIVSEYAEACVAHGWEVRLFGGGKHRSSPKRPARRRTADIALELTVLDLKAKRANLEALDLMLPAEIPILSSSVTVMVAEQGSWIARPSRLLGIGALPSLLQNPLVELAASPATSPATVSIARKFFESLGKESELVVDSAGLVLPRVIAMLANEACFALMEGIAGRDDIDSAMKLGTRYPYGPFEWTERVGVRYVHAVVSALHDHYGDDHYRVAPLLRLASMIGNFPAVSADRRVIIDQQFAGSGR